jgi:hypothetical protein
MKTRARLLSAAVAVGAAGTVLVGVAPAAQAVQGQSSCPGEVLCLYQYKNYGGQMLKVASNSRLTSLGSWDNKPSSMVNNSGYTIYLYSDKNYKGSSYTAKHDSVDTTFSNNHFDNTASSVHGH